MFNYNLLPPIIIIIILQLYSFVNIIFILFINLFVKFYILQRTIKQLENVIQLKMVKEAFLSFKCKRVKQKHAYV